MKKIYIALAVLATAALTSCQEEKSFNGEPVGDGDVAFILQAGPSTRAADLDSPVTKGISVPIGKAGDMNLYLEETISDLGYVSPETRGVPVFTENVGKLYSDKLFVHAAGFGDATFVTDGVVGDGWRYTHHYGSKDPWPANNATVDFYLRMPSDMTGVTFGESAYASGAKTTFSYTSPVTAEAQTDIIFTGISLDEATHKANVPKGGTPVTFYHALTAVKFAIANPSSEISSMSIQVDSIAFIGLKNTGTCTVDPYATGTTPKVTWPSTSAVADENGKNVISQYFGANSIVDFDTTKNPDFGSTFFNPATDTNPGTDKQNINTQTASKTFWLIPQAFSGSTAVLHIVYTMNGNKEYMDLNLGEVLKSVEWKAGQLRTYTIKLDEVNVKIRDRVKMAAQSTETVTYGSETFSAVSYKGSYKDSLTITNTGNTDAFIRAALIGQWYDFVENEPVFGYSDLTGGDILLVESWYQDQFVNTTHEHGKFEGLVGYDGATSDFWVKGDDGYYYFKYIVPVGKSIPGENATNDPAFIVPPGETAPTATKSTPIFSKYTILSTPAVAVGGAVKDVYFVLEIATQAISARKLDGTYYNTYSDAWANAYNQINAPEASE